MTDQDAKKHKLVFFKPVLCQGLGSKLEASGCVFNNTPSLTTTALLFSIKVQLR